MVQQFDGLNFEKMIQPEDIAEMVSFVAKVCSQPPSTYSCTTDFMQFPDNACPTEMTVMPQRSPYTK